MEVKVVAVLCCINVCFATICASDLPVLPCPCTKLSTTQVQVQKLQSYVVQTSPCYINAIGFYTVKKHLICSAPESPWAQRSKKYLDEQRIKKPTPSKPPVYRTSTSTTSSVTPSTTSFVQTFECTSTSKTPLSSTTQTPTSSKPIATLPTVETDPTSSLPTTMITPSVTNRSPVLYTRKINWIKKRQNRKKKPGLKAKVTWSESTTK